MRALIGKFDIAQFGSTVRLHAQVKLIANIDRREVHFRLACPIIACHVQEADEIDRTATIRCDPGGQGVNPMFLFDHYATSARLLHSSNICELEEALIEKGPPAKSTGEISKPLQGVCIMPASRTLKIKQKSGSFPQMMADEVIVAESESQTEAAA